MLFSLGVCSGCAGQTVRNTPELNDPQAEQAEPGLPFGYSMLASSQARPLIRTGEASVPTFVVSGSGAWTATSCDLGETWTVSEHAADHEDHGPFSNIPGLWAERGLFLLATGWGAPGHLYVSENAVDWSELRGDDFRRQGVPTPLGTLSGLAKSHNRYLVFGSENFQSTDGKSFFSFDPKLPHYTDQLRLVQSFPERGIILLSAENQRHADHFIGYFSLVSTDGARTWKEAKSLPQSCGGGAASAWYQGALYLANRGLCRSRDLGETWGEAAFPSEQEIAWLFSDAQQLFALSGSRLYRTSDGEAWTLVHDFGVHMAFGAFGEGRYVVAAAGGTQFFYSGDLSTWNEGRVHNPIPNHNLRRIAFAYGVPSARCALRQSSELAKP